MVADPPPTLLADTAAPLVPFTGRFVGGVHHFALRVYYEDTDVGGIVYHANYLRYLERARSDMLMLAGVDQRAAIEAGEGGYAVTEASLRYRAPARLGDALAITSRLDTVRAASCRFIQEIRRDDVLLVEARVTAALLDGAGRPRRQPPEWIAAFAAACSLSESPS